MLNKSSIYLTLPYDSPCCNAHGHNWIIDVTVASPKLTSYGMVVDFKIIKELIHGKLDHKYLNEVLPVNLNPTAENIAEWCHDVINDYLFQGNLFPETKCIRVQVHESEGNVAVFEVPYDV